MALLAGLTLAIPLTPEQWQQQRAKQLDRLQYQYLDRVEGIGEKQQSSKRKSEIPVIHRLVGDSYWQAVESAR